MIAITLSFIELFNGYIYISETHIAFISQVLIFNADRFCGISRFN